MTAVFVLYINVYRPLFLKFEDSLRPGALPTLPIPLRLALPGAAYKLRVALFTENKVYQCAPPPLKRETNRSLFPSSN